MSRKLWNAGSSMILLVINAIQKKETPLALESHFRSRGSLTADAGAHLGKQSGTHGSNQDTK
jgi:hypothetical protein